jgi:hypothetical protein
MNSQRIRKVKKKKMRRKMEGYKKMKKKRETARIGRTVMKVFLGGYINYRNIRN